MRAKPTARKAARAATILALPPVFCIDAPRRPRTPTVADQIAMLEFEIAALRDNYTVRIGPTKGTIEDKNVLWEIQCLDAALGSIKNSHND